MYTIGQVSEMFHLPVSTLRYYDKEGLFPNLKRESGIRKFNDHELEALRMIECLKASGLDTPASGNSRVPLPGPHPEPAAKAHRPRRLSA